MTGGAGDRRRGAPVLAVAGFEGPLDRLLEMVRAQRIDLARLPVLALVEAFAEALESGLAELDDGSAAPLWRWGDWLVMAASLALMRSRLLLPADPAAADARAEAEALRQRLAARLLVSARTDWLERRPQLGREVFARARPELPAAGRQGDLTDLLRACLAALLLPDEAETYRLPPPLWRVADAIARIQAMLAVPSAPWRPLAAFMPPLAPDLPQPDLRQRAALASTLVAGLELARAGRLTLQQETPFGPVLLAGTPMGDGHADPA